MYHQEHLQKKCMDTLENLIKRASESRDNQITVALIPLCEDTKCSWQLLISMKGSVPFFQVNETFYLHELETYEHETRALNSYEVLDVIHQNLTFIENQIVFTPKPAQKLQSDDLTTVHLTSFQVNSLKRLEYLIKQHALTLAARIPVDKNDRAKLGLLNDDICRLDGAISQQAKILVGYSGSLIESLPDFEDASL